MRVGFRLNPYFYEDSGPAAVLATLKSRGLDAVESGMAPGMPEWDVRDCVVGACRAEGLHWQFHSRFDTGLFGRGVEWNEKVPAYTETLEWLATVAEDIGETVNVTVHGPQAHKVGLPWLGIDRMAAATCECLQWLHDQAQHLGANIRICLENLPHKPGIERIGDSVAGLLEIRERLGAEWLGFCWDIGHELEEASYRTVEILPEFVAHVWTVHVHDAKVIDDLAVAHQLPGPGFSTFRERFRALKALKRDIALILEIGRGLADVAAERRLDTVGDAVAAVRREWAGA